MNKALKLFLIFLFISLISGCARSYHIINPTTVYYNNTKPLTEDVKISYKYDEQLNARNKRYSKKEKKNNMALIAVKVENNSNSTLVLNSNNFQVFTSSGTTLPFISGNTYTEVVKQITGIYLLYGIAGLSYSWGTDVNGNEFKEITFNPIPLLIGLGNTLLAHFANKSQIKSIQLNRILDKPILPGSSLSGFLILPVSGYPELNFVYYKDKLK